MAADTKRGAVQWISVGTGDDHFMDVSVGEVEHQLARLGLHVVTAAEKAVLDAALDYHRLDTSVNEQCLRHYCRVAIGARREAAK